MRRFSLEGQAAIITGGSRGIGRAIALAFSAAGASVALAARGEEELHRTASEVQRAGGRALPVPTEVTDPAQVQDLVDRAVDAFGTVDVLVNNAGAAPFRAPVEGMRLQGFEKYFRVNFTSALICTKAVAPILLEKRSGSVLNIASVAGFGGSPGLAYYATAKAALISLTKTVAREWAASNVRVNALAPGWVETEMNREIREAPERNEAVLASIPLGRWGRADEIAAAALFLCSRGASFITGAVLVADGGQTAGVVTGI